MLRRAIEAVDAVLGINGDGGRLHLHAFGKAGPILNDFIGILPAANGRSHQIPLSSEPNDAHLRRAPL